jgi:hypothetical protein
MSLLMPACFYRRRYPVPVLTPAALQMGYEVGGGNRAGAGTVLLEFGSGAQHSHEKTDKMRIWGGGGAAGRESEKY